MVLESCWENFEILSWVLFVKNVRWVIDKNLNKDVRGGLAVFFKKIYKIYTAKYSGKIRFSHPEQLTVLNIKINFSHKNTIWDNLRSFKDLNINRVIRKPWKNFTRNFWLTFG